MTGTCGRAVVAAAVAAMSLTAGAQGAYIVGYDMFGVAGNSAFVAPTDVADNVTGGNMVRGDGLSPASASNSFSSSGWADSDPGNYVAFSFSVDPGYHVELETLVLGAYSSSTGPKNMAIRTSADGFASDFHTFVIPDGASFYNAFVDVSAFDNVTGNFEVRFYGDGASSSGGTFRIHNHYDGAVFTTFGLTGEVVPEPSSLILLGMGTAVLVTLRRRRTA